MKPKHKALTLMIIYNAIMIAVIIKLFRAISNELSSYTSCASLTPQISPIIIFIPILLIISLLVVDGNYLYILLKNKEDEKDENI